MGFGNVSERRSAPPQVGVSVVILALGPEGDTGNSAADSGNAAKSTHSPQPSCNTITRDRKSVV